MKNSKYVYQSFKKLQITVCIVDYRDALSLIVHHLPRNHHFKIYGQRTIKDVKKFKIPICYNQTTDFLVVIIFFCYLCSPNTKLSICVSSFRNYARLCANCCYNGFTNGSISIINNTNQRSKKILKYNLFQFIILTT